MAAPTSSTMRALVVQEGKTVAVQDVPVPTLGDNEVLIKVVAIAQNPTDWKHVEFRSPPGTIIGCDFSGIVVKLGGAPAVHLKPGDHVAGFVQGGHWNDRGAFAEYLKTDSDLVWVVPEGTVSHEEAATMGCGLWTAAQALYHPTRLGLTEPPAKSTSNTWVFIYGGSTSVGQFAIQLAHLSGYKVATVASPRNHALVKALGADAVFDYKSPDVVAQLKSATHDSLHVALDTYATGETQTLSVNAFGPGPGKLVVIQNVDPEAQKVREDIVVQNTLLYTALGREFTMGKLYPPSAEDRAQMAAFLVKLPALVKDGNVKPNPVKLWEGGLGVVRDGLTYMREGKISAEKIVYKV
ncbi:GroES-like protein [Ramaria rubella]|nr:GroES-like protein [Ramaria rubella]